MTDALHDIDDDELKRRIMHAEQLLDRLYSEKFRRTRDPVPKNDTPDLKRRRNDTTTKGA